MPHNINSLWYPPLARKDVDAFACCSHFYAAESPKKFIQHSSLIAAVSSASSTSFYMFNGFILFFFSCFCSLYYLTILHCFFPFFQWNFSPLFFFFLVSLCRCLKNEKKEVCSPFFMDDLIYANKVNLIKVFIFVFLRFVENKIVIMVPL